MSVRKKRVQIGISALLLMALLLPLSITAGARYSETNAPEIVIYFTGETRGAYDHATGKVSLDKVATLVRETADEVPATFLLDTGDAIQGEFFSNSNEGMAAIEIMTAANYDAMCLGNHDFAYGYRRITWLARFAGFPFLTQASAFEKGDHLSDSVIIDRGGYKLGVFGLTTLEARKETRELDKDFGDAATLLDTAKRKAKALREQGADVVICLSHIGNFSSDVFDYGSVYDIASSVLGINLIIDGHGNGYVSNSNGNIPIAFADSTQESLGVARFYKTTSGFEVEIDTITAAQMAEVEPDAETAAVISKWSHNADTASGMPIRYNTTALTDFNKTVIYKQETKIGNFVADAQRAVSGADIAFVAAGSIQASLPAGDIYPNNLYSILPCCDSVYIAEVSGAAIVAALERSVSISLREKSCNFLQVSGISFSYALGGAEGERVKSVTVGGELIDPQKKYKLAASDIVVALDGDYDMLIAPFSDATYVGGAADILLDYVSNANSQLEQELEGRIVKLESSKTEQPQKTPEELLNSEALIAVELILIVLAFIIVRWLRRKERGENEQ